MNENKEKIRTLEEFAIKEIQDLREEKQVLEERQEKLLEINNNLGNERDEWKNKYYELIEKIKEDFQVQIQSNIGTNPYICVSNYILSMFPKEKYEYYKNLFNLKEEGEEENE